VKILIATRNSTEHHLVLLFGLGLIGSAICEALLRLEFKSLADILFDWQDDSQMADARDAIESVCLRNSRMTGRLTFLWCAGTTGFYSSPDEADREYAVFRKTVGFALDLQKRLQPADFSFHSVSSAGGLFEGQRVIRETSRPTPVRPYGVLKKQQEDLLLNTFSETEIAIYRPSSVYGPMEQKSRHGLINNLILNARTGRITVLDAHVMSLRDYVFAGDIGNFVARRIRFERDESTNRRAQFLVSARCSSIFEVFQKIKRILNLHAQFRYDDQFGNHKNITFSDSVLPPGWRPVALDVGIRQFMIGR
jgi:nucleoside-diphosphate-sugar epimerase